MKTAVRFRPLRSTSALAAATCHALRQDATGRARVRPGAEPGHGLSWTAYDGPDRDHLAAFRAHKAATGAMERKGAPIALQALCVVSPEWIDAAGDRHDEANPRNQALFDQAKAWAESWAGKGSVLTVRLDLDERGGGVVDLTIVPTQVQRSKAGSEKTRISTNSALQALCDQTGERRSYAAAQTSWATWCQATLDPALERGRPREETGAEHLRPEEYGRVADELTVLREQVARLETQRAGLASALEEAEAKLAMVQAERDEARLATQRLLERAQEAARAKVAEAQRRAQETTRKAVEEAQELQERGRAWAEGYAAKVRTQADAYKARVRDEAAAEAEALREAAIADAEAAGQARLDAILAPAKTFFGRLGLVKVRTDAEREAEAEAIRKAVREDEAGVRQAFKEGKEAADAKAAKLGRQVSSLTESLRDRTAERDKALARLRTLEPQRQPSLDRGPTLD